MKKQDHATEVRSTLQKKKSRHGAKLFNDEQEKQEESETLFSIDDVKLYLQCITHILCNS
jgi:hypothetical protein